MSETRYFGIYFDNTIDRDIVLSTADIYALTSCWRPFNDLFGRL
jgi:hypothetical protein